MKFVPRLARLGAIALLTLAAGTAFAQSADEDQPADIDFGIPADDAADAPRAPPASGAPVPQAPIEVVVPDDAGSTTIMGEQDSPIGLYIMPWRNSGAGDGLGRPARLLEEAMLPIDRDVFKRQVDYYETLSAHRARQAAKVP